MSVYEMRTYTLQVGKMAEAVKLYTEIGYPILERDGFAKHLVGYWQADTGMINQLVHLWRFENDDARRKFWAGLYGNRDFIETFAPKLRALLVSQEVKLLVSAPWGPRP